jgi:hypothetical protein
MIAKLCRSLRLRIGAITYSAKDRPGRDSAECVGGGHRGLRGSAISSRTDGDRRAGGDDRGAQEVRDDYDVRAVPPDQAA